MATSSPFTFATSAGATFAFGAPRGAALVGLTGSYNYIRLGRNCIEQAAYLLAHHICVGYGLEGV
jgi:hypothetical protein